MNKYNKQELEKLILEEKISYTGIGRMYGVSGSAIKKAARKLGIPIPRRRAINKNENFSHPCRKKNSLVNRISDDEFIRIIEESSEWQEIGRKLRYKSPILSINVKQSIEERVAKLGIKLNIHLQECSVLLDKTKGELFGYRKNWQSARGCIRRIACEIYKEEHPELQCAICGYNKHIEVAHIKSVSSFRDDATIREINSIDNLIGLCPNHHWEYDHGLLKL